jgi:hypothetical protein
MLEDKKDGRANNGGHSTKGKAGRKPKTDEEELIKRLTPLDDLAYEALKEGLEEKKSWAVNLFFNYKYGKPKQYKAIEIKQPQEKMSIPVINFTHGN